MRLTWRKRSAAPGELLVLFLFVFVTLFVVIGERNRFPAAQVGHRGSPEVGDLPEIRCVNFIRHRRCGTPGQWSGDHQADVTSQ